MRTENESQRKQIRELQSQIKRLKEHAPALQSGRAPIKASGPWTETVTMQQIATWSADKLPDEDIINRIKTSHSTYGLTAEDVSWLQGHGVTPRVIETMMVPDGNR